MHEVLVNRIGGLSLSRKSMVRLIDCPDMTIAVYRGRTTATHNIERECGNGTKQFETFDSIYIQDDLR